MHTRPSGESTYRRTGLIAVLVSAIFVANALGAPAVSQAKQRLQTGSNGAPKAATKAVAAPVKGQAKAQRLGNKPSAPQVTKPNKVTTKGKSTVKIIAGSDTKSVRTGKAVVRETKVQRSRPVNRQAKVKSSSKLASAAGRKGAQRMAKAQISDDPWQRAVQLDRAKMRNWDNIEAREPRIVLPNLFGDDDDERGASVLNVATGLLGRPYRFGARGYAFDCSGFVAEVFEQVGVDLPHSARDQFTIGDRVTRDDLAPGDLVFFRTYTRGPSHVGIYMGGDKFIHSASGIGVKISSLNEDYYSARYLGARRMEL